VLDVGISAALHRHHVVARSPISFRTSLADAAAATSLTGPAVALRALASEIRRSFFRKNLKKLLIPGTAVLYFAKVLRFRDVNRKKGELS